MEACSAYPATDGRPENMKLTAREFEICNLISLGLRNKEIARQLGIGHRTVEGHRAEIYRKLGVRNAVELLRKITWGPVND